MILPLNYIEISHGTKTDTSLLLFLKKYKRLKKLYNLHVGIFMGDFSLALLTIHNQAQIQLGQKIFFM